MRDKLDGNLYAALHDLMPCTIRNTAKATIRLEGAEVGFHVFSSVTLCRCVTPIAANILSKRPVRAFLAGLK